MIAKLNRYASKYELATFLIFRQHPRLAFGMQKDVNIWLRDRSPNWHLTLLIGLQLQLNWEGRLNLITTSPSLKDEGRLYSFLERLSDTARLPANMEFHVLIGEFEDLMQKAPNSDINIFGLGDSPFDFMRNAHELTKSSCIFVRDSGHENALV